MTKALEDEPAKGSWMTKERIEKLRELWVRASMSGVHSPGPLSRGRS